MFLDQYRTTLQKTNRIASFHRGLEPLIYFDRIGFPCCLLRWVAHSFTVDQTALIKLWAMLSRERGVTSRVKTWEMRIIELTLGKCPKCYVQRVWLCALIGQFCWVLRQHTLLSTVPLSSYERKLLWKLDMSSKSCDYMCEKITSNTVWSLMFWWYSLKPLVVLVKQQVLTPVVRANDEGPPTEASALETL